MMVGIEASCGLVVICIVQLFFVIRKRKKKASTFALLSPSVVFIVGVLARFGLGTLIMSLTPENLVLDGEYRQYMVSWLYSQDVALTWAAYMLAGGLIFLVLEGSVNKYERKEVGYTKNGGWFGWIKEVRHGKERDGLMVRVVTFCLLVVFLFSALISAYTGSMDRGLNYEYWAGLRFRPEAAFIAFARLRQVAYFLLPIAWIRCNRYLKIVLAVTAFSPLLLEAIAGGRGAVLYPVVMIFTGYLCVGLKPKKMVVVGIVLIAFLGFAVPYMAAYRDGEATSAKSHRDVIGRLSSFVSGVDSKMVAYRYMALGREIYACSDGFVVEDTKKGGLKVGVNDLDLGLLAKILVPRWIAKDQEYAKSDGSSIAKSLMGVKNDNWFPCITTPADLYRRERWMGVFIGGTLMGILIWSLDRVWLIVGMKGRSIETLMLTLLPVAYYQTGLYGTIRELIWQLAWDLPKYLLLFVVVGQVYRASNRIGMTSRKEAGDSHGKE